MSTQTLDPEPIPLDVKVVLFGDRQLYYLLAANDPDFDGLFKVQADFDDTIVRSDDNHQSLLPSHRINCRTARSYACRLRRCGTTDRGGLAPRR